MLYPITAPGRNITERNVTISVPDVVVTVDLPITEFVPSNLSIISTVTPNDTAEVRADFPFSYRYTVTFTDLNPGVDYNYTVRIVTRDVMTDEVANFTGSFSTPATPPPRKLAFIILGVHPVSSQIPVHI